jgi:hypothetical protein
MLGGLNNEITCTYGEHASYIAVRNVSTEILLIGLNFEESLKFSDADAQ